ncbi:methyltransferase domain-containing protein [Halobaculum sp. MBLA0147]|uniref:methyltransferase domain-containing protein n=1 Tax=Halobaculum sp. MBLA0147 TaxID=3079934 RepID=UPI003525D5A1
MTHLSTERDHHTVEHPATRPLQTSVYDWWSRHPRAMRLLYALSFLGRESTFRDRARDALAPAPGERLLELGCGDGRALPHLAAAVGPDGHVLGLDASEGMTTAAAARTASDDTVSVVRGDGRRLPVPDGTLDGAYSAMALSAVPEPAAAVDAVHAALHPGGRYVVLDARPFADGPLRAIDALTVPISRRLTDWVPSVDLVATLRDRFETVSVDTYNAGSIVLVRAERGD